MKTLTVFTPTYNRKHTIDRTFESLCLQSCNDFDWLIIDDGSNDGTKEWVESLGNKIISTGPCFDWMGRPIEGCDENHFVIETDPSVHGKKILIEFVHKPNGGLYTGYNTAYSIVQSELCVCIDSDDYMPDDAVEKICSIWSNCKNDKKWQHLGGIVGLDFNVVDHKPIGGYFPKDSAIANYLDIAHSGDCKHVMRTALMKSVCPQIGFQGEKDFNPYYMLMQVCDKFPMYITNTNFCWVEYQTGGDSMSAGIWRQYIRSPKSYARYRIMQMQLKHGNDLKNRIRLSIHYVSSCIISKDRNWVRNTPYKLLAVFVSPMGLLLSWLIRFKNHK